MLLSLYFILTQVEVIQPSPKWSFVSWLGYTKMVVTVFKYLPQVYWNCVRETTHGWSIVNVLLDFGGGFFSFVEVVLRCFYTPHYQLNVAKVGLGLLCIAYNIVFIVQHYCLYPSRDTPSTPVELAE